jgi:glycosyltransferase involved in cell wall biosynthesis
MTYRLQRSLPVAACEPEASAPGRRRLRILYLQPSPLFGGAERQLTSMSPLLHHHGIDVLPLVGPGRVIVDWFHEQGVSEVMTTANFPGEWDRLRGPARLTLPFRYVSYGARARAEILGLVRDNAIDAVLASLPFAWITGGLASRAAGVPIIWRAGGVGPSWLERFLLSLASPFVLPDLLLCNAESVLNVFGPLVPAPSLVIPNGVDQRVFHPAAGDEARFRPRDAELVVGSAMRLAPSKRPQDFVELAARLRQRHPKTQFLLAGDGSCRSALESLARRSGADNLRFLGFVSDMQSFYRACDVLVLPSSSEGSPNFVLEAMATQKALALAAIAPLLELVGRDNALWFVLGNTDQLTASVSRLLSSSALRRTLGERALQHASSYSLRACAARLASALRVVVASPKASGPAPAATLPQPEALQAREKSAAE